MRRLRLSVMAAALGCAGAWGTHGAELASGAPGAPSYAAGEVIWNQRCTTCHDHPVDRIPPRSALGYKTPQGVVYTLTHGIMRPQAQGLSDEQIRDVAAYITRKEPGRGGDIDVSVDIHANLCKSPAPPMRLSDADWNGWGADGENTRFNPHPGLRAADVPKLKVKWAFAYPSQPGFQPALAGGRLFVSSRSGQLWSLDPHTGCTYWVLDLGVMARGAVIVQALPKGAAAKFAAYFATQDNHLKAVDAESGKPLWDTQIGDSTLQQISSSAAFYQGRIYQGLASLDEVAIRDPKFVCCTVPGTVVAVDALSGAIIWKTKTVTEEPKQIGVNTAGTPVFGPAGASVWATPLVDPVRHAVVVATANSNSPISIAQANAVIALSLDTGKTLWVTQVLANDNVCPHGWDGPGTCETREADFTGGVILRRLPNGKRVILAGAKSGEVYAFDPDDDGKLLWHRQTHDASNMSGRWGFAADARNLYVNSNSVIPAYGAATHPPGGIAAVDLSNGEQNWFAKPQPAKCSWSTEQSLKRPTDCNGSQQAGLALIPGVLFAGSVDGHSRGYDTRSGQVVWDFDTGGSWDGVNGAKATGGSLSYGTFAVGYGMLFVDSGAPGWHEGNALIAFSVDGK